MTDSNKKITHVDFKTHDLIFSEGEVGFHFFIVESGRVQIFTKNTSGTRVNIATVEKGESFGEFALLDKKPRSASARALEDCKIAKISPEGYEELLAELPVWAISMMKSFARRMKTTNEILQQVPQFLSREDDTVKIELK